MNRALRKYEKCGGGVVQIKLGYSIDYEEEKGDYRIADYWTYEFIIEMKDGKTFSFSNRDFDRRISGAKDNCLDKMLEIKSLFNPDLITVKGAKNISEVSEFLGFDEQQAAKLRQLFTE